MCCASPPVRREAPGGKVHNMRRIICAGDAEEEVRAVLPPHGFPVNKAR